MSRNPIKQEKKRKKENEAKAEVQAYFRTHYYYLLLWHEGALLNALFDYVLDRQKDNDGIIIAIIFLL